MRKVCAWCKKELDSDLGTEAGTDAPISHGICPDCIPKFFPFLGKPMREFLDEFPGPIFLVDADNRVLSANREGLALINKQADEIEGQTPGDVFDCPSANQAAGCGKSIHCKTCTIRHAIAGTLATGQAHDHLPAFADLHGFCKEQKIKFAVSTEKLGNAVLLRIDDLP